MEHFRKESQIGAPAEVVFTWHEAPEAFEKLIPPWENVCIIERSAQGIQIGTKTILEMSLGPFKRRWVALHTHYEPGRMFRDEQVSGPFSAWVHTHVIEARGPRLSLLIDDISYKLPLGLIGQIFGGWLVRRKLKRLFDYRHHVTRQACERRSIAFEDNASRKLSGE